jgi:hypothetical protein
MAKTPGRDSVMSLVLRSQRYNCARCQVPQHAMVIRTSKGGYFTCDEFQQQYFKSKGKTVFKVHLRLCFKDGDKTNFAISNLHALCPQCTQTFLKELDRDFKEIAIQNRIGLNISLIVSIKNFVESRTGAELSTRDCLALIDLLTQNHKYER